MAQQTQSPTPGYDHQEPFERSMLQVDEIHSLHYEQYGLANGLPVVFLHGGPGGQTSFANTRFFNPALYRVVLFDQRGVGKSRPRNETRNNTSHHLVSDIEKLREHLGIEKWHMVFGGSWGTTLGLLYTQTHPDRVKSLVLRGVFTGTDAEVALSRQSGMGAAACFPDEHERFIGFIPEEERDNIGIAYHKRVTSGDPEVANAAAREWNRWSSNLTTTRPGPDLYDKLDDLEWSFTHALMETHYFTQGAWLEDGQLLSNVDKMRHIPGAIVQGRWDLLCPPLTAWKLHKAWPRSTIHFIPDAGHNATEPGTFRKLIEVCDEFARLE